MPLPPLPAGVHPETVLADLRQLAQGNSPAMTRAAFAWVAAVVALAILEAQE
jgi:hypothetical protein